MYMGWVWRQHAFLPDRQAGYPVLLAVSSVGAFGASTPPGARLRQPLPASAFNNAHYSLTASNFPHTASPPNPARACVANPTPCFPPLGLLPWSSAASENKESETQVGLSDGHRSRCASFAQVQAREWLNGCRPNRSQPGLPHIA